MGGARAATIFAAENFVKKPPQAMQLAAAMASPRRFEPPTPRLRVVKTVSRFVTGFHSRYQKTPVFGRLWMYCIPYFHA